jgi:hypothetical protein
VVGANRTDCLKFFGFQALSALLNGLINFMTVLDMNWGVG